MLQQLRPVPVSGEGHPAVRDQPARRAAGAAVRRRRQCPRLLERGRPGETYHINGDAELTNTELTAALLECCGAGWDMVARVPDRKGHDRRYSLDDGVLRAGDGVRAARPVPPGPGGDGALVCGQPCLVGTA